METATKMVAATWDSLLDLVRQWMIVRFALNTDPEGLRQLMNDVDGATNGMGKWLRKQSLGTGEE